MARIPRMLVKQEDAIYHVISRTALDGFVLGDVEKDYLFDLIKKLSALYFTEVFGYCIMGNHFHLLVKMKTGNDYSDNEVKRRIGLSFSEENRGVTDGQLPYFRDKFSNLSEFVREIKQKFARYYNKKQNRSGYFWGSRFKSVIVENGDTLINLLAYIDLNPVRANMVERPDDYRWSSIGYHVQTNNKNGFLSCDFGLTAFNDTPEAERLRDYREFLYEKGGIESSKGASINETILENERIGNYELTNIDRFRNKTRYFTDSGIIGTKSFVNHYYGQFKDYFNKCKTKKPNKISGCDGIYSLKNLSGGKLGSISD